jgi:phage tail sheath protein FI
MRTTGVERDSVGARERATVPIETDEVTPAGIRIECADSGTPLLVGFTAAGPVGEPIRVGSFAEFEEVFGDGGSGPFVRGGVLPYSIRGFFRNGGRTCWVQRVEGQPGSGRINARALTSMVEAPQPIVAVPDAWGLAGGAATAVELLRRLIADADEAHNRMVVVDPPPGLSPAAAIVWRRQLGIDSPSAVVYYPWIEVLGAPLGGSIAVPPSGHVLGSWARSEDDGLHRAPTGESLLGVDGFPVSLTAAEQRRLNREGVNCLRAFPGPEPRIWGARTLSSDPDWRYLNRRRTFTNLIVSIVEGTRWVAEEELDDGLLDQVTAAVAAFLQAAWRRGALHGASVGQAFFVRANADEQAGNLALEVGVALRQPADYRVVRVVMRTGSAG